MPEESASVVFNHFKNSKGVITLKSTYDCLKMTKINVDKKELKQSYIALFAKKNKEVTYSELKTMIEDHTQTK